MIQSTPSITIKNTTTQNVSKKRRQQRQILAMMGIDVWVQHTTQTVTVDEQLVNEQLFEEQSGFIDKSNRLEVNSDKDGKQNTANQLPSITATTASPATAVSDNSKQYFPSVSSPSQDMTVTPDSDIANLQSTQENLAAVSIDYDDSQPSHKAFNHNEPSHKNLSHTDTHNLANSAPVISHASRQTSNQQRVEEVVAPFDLFAAIYNNWVILVDAQNLTDPATAKLWQNIMIGLSLNVEQLSFPICDGINDLMAAQASVDGFIFHMTNKATRHDQKIKVAALTALPDRIIPQQLVTVPTLGQMLADPNQKRALWSLLSAST